MAKSRTQKAIRNVSASLLNNAVALVCGLILPRLILSNFGSDYNGIVQSISQFISYIALMQSGIGGATTAALYKPLAKKDDQEISEILYSTQKYMRKIAFIFLVFVAILSIVYPLFIVKDFGFVFTATLVVVISLSTFAEYYFGFTYQCLLDADQKGYLYNYLSAITVILNAIVSVILINNNCSIQIVKLGASIVFMIRPIFTYFYVKKKYKLDNYAPPTIDKIPQKWNAAAHEVAGFINNNTDILVLTFFSTLSSVSIYTVYHYVTASIKKIVTNFTVGFCHAFGDMYAKEEYDLFEKNLGIYELIIYSLSTLFCAVALVVIVPFVTLYTKGVTDAEYKQPLFALIMILACAFNCYRVPYRTIVYALGRYKETRNGAILEAVLNVVISIATVIKFGLIGVAIGTLIAMAFRTLQFGIYLYTKVMNKSSYKLFKHIFVSFLVMAITYLVSTVIYTPQVSTWYDWILYAVSISVIVVLEIVVTNLAFFKKDSFYIIKKLKDQIS